MNRYRRNPGMSLAQLATAARQMGKTNLAAMLERGGPAAEAVAAEINLALEEPTTPPAPARASSGLSDREAWLELAALVPRAFADQPEPVQRALVEAFRQQAAA